MKLPAILLSLLLVLPVLAGEDPLPEPDPYPEAAQPANFWLYLELEVAPQSEPDKIKLKPVGGGWNKQLRAAGFQAGDVLFLSSPWSDEYPWLFRHLLLYVVPQSDPEKIKAVLYPQWYDPGTGWNRALQSAGFLAGTRVTAVSCPRRPAPTTWRNGERYP